MLEECCKRISSLLESLDDKLEDPLESGSLEDMNEGKVVESLALNIVTMWKDNFERSNSLSREVSHLQELVTKKLSRLEEEVQYLHLKLKVSMNL